MAEERTVGAQPGPVAPAPALRGSRTEANLKAAFAGESQAYRKYEAYAARARADGYEAIAAIYEETARNEAAHAEIWLELLQGGQLPCTGQNLDDAGDGEHYEWEQMYPGFAEEARREGFEQIAARFDAVAAIEHRHEARFRKLAEQVKTGKVFTAAGEQMWICRNCGHVHVGKEAPGICPVCGKPQAWFEPAT